MQINRAIIISHSNYRQTLGNSSNTPCVCVQLCLAAPVLYFQCLGSHASQTIITAKHTLKRGNMCECTQHTHTRTHKLNDWMIYE